MGLLPQSSAKTISFTLLSARAACRAYIVPMTYAYTFGARSLTSQLTLTCETVYLLVDGDPQALYSDSRVWLTYSASACESTHVSHIIPGLSIPFQVGHPHISLAFSHGRVVFLFRGLRGPKPPQDPFSVPLMEIMGRA